MNTELLARRIDDMEARMDREVEQRTKEIQGLRTELSGNTVVTNQVKADTAEMLSLFKSFQGAFETLQLIGKVMKPIGYIAVAFAGIAGAYAAWKGGGVSPK